MQCNVILLPHRKILILEMTKNISALSCWIVTPNGLIGTENQCIGVANALNIDYQIKRIELNQPWRGLTPLLKFENQFCFSTSGDALEPPWPDLVIAAGRRAIPAARYIRKMSQRKTYVVFLQDPHCDTRSFDLVAAPKHDRVRGSNVIQTVGAPNKITSVQLDEAKKKFEKLFSPLPAPRVGVIIGGNSKTHRMTTDITLKLCNQLVGLQQSHNCSLMITASRRTGDRNNFLIEQNLSHSEDCYLWDGRSENPYLGILGWADYLLVTEDSVSMLCDAASTGKPVYKVALEGRSKKFDLFYKTLEDHGAMRPFCGKLASWSYERIQDADYVATAIKDQLINLGKITSE